MGLSSGAILRPNGNHNGVNREAQQEAAAAIRALRQRIQWKPGKDIQHLEKRKALGHLPVDATLQSYNQIICAIVDGHDNEVYLYPFGRVNYYAIRGTIAGRAWLVIFSKDGLMETAFPPDNLPEYLLRRGFVRIGKMAEVLL